MECRAAWTLVTLGRFMQRGQSRAADVTLDARLFPGLGDSVEALQKE